MIIGIRHFGIVVENLEYIYPSSGKGIKPVSFAEESGQLIGILGKEGTGKSTLLELLSGTLKPTSGKIFINGYNFVNNSYLLKNIIGYVSEKDHLFES